MTRYSSAGTGGRQLLSIKRKLSTESDPDAIRSLRRREIRLLVSMGHLGEAASRSAALAADFSDWPEARSLHGDVLSRVQDWEAADAEFRRAVELHERAGDTMKAVRLAQGPLYRQAEADGRFGECARLASYPGHASPVLRCRALRLAGTPGAVPGSAAEDYPGGALLELELAWRGGDASGLPAVVGGWPGFEPEWRWRVLVEGIGIWQDRNRDCHAWRKHFRGTDRPVLDPRFRAEAAMLDRIFGRGKKR